MGRGTSRLGADRVNLKGIEKKEGKGGRRCSQRQELPSSDKI